MQAALYYMQVVLFALQSLAVTFIVVFRTDKV